jgi:hypothetical protein
MSSGIASVKKDASRDLLNDAFNMKESAGIYISIKNMYIYIFIYVCIYIK